MRVVVEMKIFSNAELKKIFPEYAEEMDEISNNTACGCAGCTLNELRRRYPDKDFPIPDEWSSGDVIVC